MFYQNNPKNCYPLFMHRRLPKVCLTQYRETFVAALDTDQFWKASKVLLRIPGHGLLVPNLKVAVEGLKTESVAK